MRLHINYLEKVETDGVQELYTYKRMARSEQDKKRDVENENYFLIKNNSLLIDSIRKYNAN